MQGIHYFQPDARITFSGEFFFFYFIFLADNQLTSCADTYAAVHPQEQKRAGRDWPDGALDIHPGLILWLEYGLCFFGLTLVKATLVGLS